MVLSCHTVDISSKGVGIKYNGKGLSRGKMLDIEVNDFNIKTQAEVMWSKQVSSDVTQIGLRLGWI